MLLQVVYTSSATRPFTKPELRELLAVARGNNRGRGVTGMLLHADGNFLQVLEGPGAVVEALLEHIAQDPRHKGVSVLMRSALEDRSFGDWTMGFVDAEALTDTQLEGFSPLLHQTPEELADFAKRSRAHSLIKSFRRLVR